MKTAPSLSQLRKQAHGLVAYARLHALSWKLKTKIKSPVKSSKARAQAVARSIRLSSRPF